MTYLKLLRRDHPKWDITQARGAWQALSHPTPTSTHVIVCYTITELGMRLDDVARRDRRP
jgi:hypothetical protein